MAIEDSAIEAVLQRADLVEVARSFLELKKSSEGTWKACCPFHQEKTPSFHINAHKQLYHCFGCGVGGNVISFVKAIVGTDYIGAIRWLADRYSMPLPEKEFNGNRDEAMRRRKFREDGMRLLEDATGWFQSNLTSSLGAEARNYLASRGIDQETVQRYRIGYAPEAWDALGKWAQQRGYSNALLEATGLVVVKEGHHGDGYDRFRNRLIFTICDELGRPVGFSGRIFAATANPKEGAKYVNSPESDFFHKGSILYGLNIARMAFRKAGFALICEGQMDVIACHRAGLEQAVAGQGTAFTEDQVRLLSKSGVKHVHVAFDGDGAGRKAMLRTIGLLQQAEMQVMVVQLPPGEDPDSIYRSGGATALQQIMSQVQNAVDFAYQVACQTHNNGATPEERTAIAEDTLRCIATIQDPLTRAGHCQWLAKNLDLPQDLMRDKLQKQLEHPDDGEHPKTQYPLHRHHAPTPKTAASPNDDDEVAGLTAALEVLLDLAANSQAVATELAANDQLLTDLPPSSIGRALNLLLATTAAGDWHGGVQMLMDGEMINDSQVSKILTVSQFFRPDAAAPPANDIVNTALMECLERLEWVRLQTAAKKLRERMAQEPNNFQLLKEAAEISRRQKELRQQRKQRNL